MLENKGFTLIEVLVSIAILAVVTTASANLFTMVISSYNKANILNELEQNGNYVMSLLAQRIRTAKSLVAYDTSRNCGTECYESSYLVIENRIEPGTGSLCTEFGYVAPDDPDPNVATTNGYVFVENSDPSVTDPAAPGCQDPAQGQNELTNRASLDPKSGISVTNFIFRIDKSEPASPPAVKISLDLYQGAIGREQRKQYQASIHLETTVSLRY